MKSQTAPLSHYKKNGNSHRLSDLGPVAAEAKSMIILVSSKITQSTIQSSLGKPEYSYFFLLKEFLPALQCIGEVITVTLDQVDTLYQQYREQGQQVIFLSISPPQQTPTNLQCPTVSQIAWEIPDTPER